MCLCIYAYYQANRGRARYPPRWRATASILQRREVVPVEGLRANCRREAHRGGGRRSRAFRRGLPSRLLN